MSNGFTSTESTISAGHHVGNNSATQRLQQLEIGEFVEKHPTWLPKTAEGIASYQIYVNKLAYRLPGSYDRLQRFLQRGSCSCCRAEEEKVVLCTCANDGGKCSCVKNDPKDPRNTCPTCSKR